MDEVSHSIGQLQGRMDAHEARSARMEAKQDAMDAKLDQLLAGQERQAGVRKVVMTASTAIGTVVGGVLTSLATWWVTKQP